MVPMLDTRKRIIADIVVKYVAYRKRAGWRITFWSPAFAKVLGLPFAKLDCMLKNSLDLQLALSQALAAPMLFEESEDV